MMNVVMKGMGLATPLALLYYHIIIVKSCSNKDNRCYLLFLEIIIQRISFPCIACLLYHVYLLICMFLILFAFVFCVGVAEVNSLATL